MLLAVLAATWFANYRAAGITRDTLYSGREGRALTILRSALLGASLGGLVVYVASPGSMTWAQLSLPAWIRWLGTAVAAAALALVVWVLQSLGRNFSTTLTIKQDQTLVTSGPYSRVRHPMYTAFTLLSIGFLLATANWFVGLTGLAAYALVMTVRTPREEEMMLGRFGDEYRAYRARTGRYLPPLRR